MRFFIPAILPFIISALKISVYQASLLITAYWIGYTAFQIPAGIISDRFGTAKTSKASFLGLTIAFFLMPIAMHEYLLIFLLQLLLGSLSSIVYVSGISLVQRSADQSNRSLFIGIFQIGFFMGSSVGEYIVLELLDISFYYSYIAVSLLLLISLTLDFLFQNEPGLSKKNNEIIPRGILYVSLIRFSAGFMYLGFLSLFTTFLVYDGIAPLSKAYAYAWIPAIGGIAGSPLGGMISRKMWHAKALMAIVPIIVFSVVLMLIGIVNRNYVPPLSFATGFLYGLYAGPSMGLASEVGREENLGTSSGILNFSSQVGGIISPLAIGYLFTYFGNFKIPFAVISVLSFVIILFPLAIFLRRLFRHTVR
ncbi:hypothetical protein [Thermoplasma volcanium GSS1]|uniref:Major facilitator superfamily (MFS) profile domain-containing protein n=1 Tax=Thermoplasma volcanium (strain ATCC 51530 / DSM 4299 / JCM 9571 / NBRC 15438 / GSS1) TaxID=273116 RepID=Q978M5_THEVO|nr:hypothetical protein [Thermoplasma volcanium GSS1]